MKSYIHVEAVKSLFVIKMRQKLLNMEKKQKNKNVISTFLVVLLHIQIFHDFSLFKKNGTNKKKN